MSNKLYNIAKTVAKVGAGGIISAGSVAIMGVTQYYAQKKKRIQDGSQVSNKKTKAQIAKNKKIVAKRKYAKALSKKRSQLDKEQGARRNKKLRAKSI